MVKRQDDFTSSSEEWRELSKDEDFRIIDDDSIALCNRSDQISTATLTKKEALKN